MFFKFEQGTRHADVVQALRQAGCVMLDDETWQPDDPTLDGCFAASGMKVYHATAHGSEQHQVPAEYFPDGQQPPAAWRVGGMYVQFRGHADPLPRELDQIRAFMEAFAQLSPARFSLEREFQETFAERTAQGLRLYPVWFKYANAEPDGDDGQDGDSSS